MLRFRSARCVLARSCGKGTHGVSPRFTLHSPHPAAAPGHPLPETPSLGKGGEIRVRICSLPWDLSQLCPWPLPTSLSSTAGSFALCHQHPDAQQGFQSSRLLPEPKTRHRGTDGQEIPAGICILQEDPVSLQMITVLVTRGGQAPAVKFS